MSEPAVAPVKLFLTAEQRALVTSVPGLAERVALGVKRAFRLPHDARELVRHAHYGIARAAQRWDGQTPFEAWARFKASRAVLDGARGQRHEDAKSSTGRQTGLLYLLHEDGQVRGDPLGASVEAAQGELDELTQGLAAAMLADVAARPRHAGGEDEVTRREDGARAAEALRTAFATLTAELRAVVALCFAGAEGDDEEATLEAVATRVGLSVSTVKRHRSRALQLLGARLAGQGITELPSWLDEPWTAFLEAEAAAALAELGRG